MFSEKNKTVKIAINGFGRIGRAAFKAYLERKPAFKVVAINDLADSKTLAYLLKYDSCYGIYDQEIKAAADQLTIAGESYKVLAEREPAKLPWRKLGIDIVLECTGRFTKKEEAAGHLKAGAKKVIISAPAKPACRTGREEEVKTIVLGVNEGELKAEDKVISMASCTTNCLAPVMEIIRLNFGIKKALMTTVHSYTADQNLVDGPHKDLRRGRTAALNIVPTTTGAARAVTRAIPGLKEKFDGLALRVPTAVGSLSDIVFLTEKKTDEKKVNQAFKRAGESKRWQGIVETSREMLVSSDIIGNPASAIVDLSLTKVIGGDLVKVVAWYDNEWGYSSRLVDLVEHIRNKEFV